jgi:hypothetical protein
MNQLVQLLRATPTVVDNLVEGGTEEVPFDRLVEILEDGEPPQRIYAEAARRAAADPAVGSYLAESFLGAVEIQDWKDLLERARPPRQGLPNEWVTLARGQSSGRGVTLPEDSSPEGRLSFFTRVADGVRRISIVRPGTPDVSVSLELERKCPRGPRGTCPEGSCDCVKERVHDPDGFDCVCCDDTTA